MKRNSTNRNVAFAMTIFRNNTVYCVTETRYGVRITLLRKHTHMHTVAGSRLFVVEKTRKDCIRGETEFCCSFFCVHRF